MKFSSRGGEIHITLHHVISQFCICYTNSFQHHWLPALSILLWTSFSILLVALLINKLLNLSWHFYLCLYESQNLTLFSKINDHLINLLRLLFPWEITDTEDCFREHSLHSGKLFTLFQVSNFQLTYFISLKASWKRILVCLLELIYMQLNSQIGILKFLLVNPKYPDKHTYCPPTFLLLVFMKKSEIISRFWLVVTPRL